MIPISDAENLSWPSAEGPDVSVFTALVLLTCGILLLRAILSRNVLVVDSGIAAFARSAVTGAADFGRPVALLVFACIYLCASAVIDLTGAYGRLYVFAALCWIVFVGVHFALYDMVCAVGSRFGLSFKSGYASVDFALAFFVGGRVLVALAIGLGALGLDATFLIVLALSLVWGTVRLANHRRQTGDTKTGHSKYLPSWGLIGACAVLAFAFLYVGFIGSYITMTTWDHFTHWLVLPQEMIALDRLHFLYETSRSVAPEYPPQQVLDFAFLLRLWGDASMSETILNMYNPFLLFIAGWIMVDVLHRRAGPWLTVGLAVGFVLAAYALPIFYWSTAYSDTRAALCLLLIAVGFFTAGPARENANLPLLVLISTCAFTLKPNLVPFALTYVPFLLLNGMGIKRVAIFALTVVALAVPEVMMYRAFSPETLLQADAFSFSSFSSASLERLNAGLSHSEHGREFYFLFAVLSALLMVSALARFSEAGIKTTLLVSAAIIAGLVGLLTVVLLNNPSFGASLDRYLLNISFVAFFALALFLSSIGTQRLRLVVGGVVTMASVATLHFTRDSLDFLEAADWYGQRLAHLSPFPVQSVTGLAFIEALQPYVDDLPGSQGILIHPFDIVLDQYYYNYALARTTPELFSPNQTFGLGPIEHILGLEDPGLIDVWLREKKIDFIYLRAPTRLAGHTIGEGLYTRDQLIAELAVSS